MTDATTERRGRLLVLLQGDDEAELVARLLSGRGYEVDLTTDPSAALGHLPSGEVTAVLLGVRQRRGDGLHLLERIRRLDPPVADVPVVCLADDDRSLERMRAWESGADGYVTKPVHIDEVAAAIERAIARTDAAERRRHRREQLDAEGLTAGPAGC